MGDANGLEIGRHATWLRRLALVLVHGDEAAAEDAVQATWLAALESPPPQGVGSGWLAVVLRNLVNLQRRRDFRRRERERAAADHASSTEGLGQDELLARHRAQHRLSQLVAELEEPYRSTVLLRYAEGLSPAQIAARQEVPAGTVRWRLKTGLDRLRAEINPPGSSSGLRALAPLQVRPSRVHKEILMAVGAKKTLYGAAALLALLLTAGSAALWRRSTHEAAADRATGAAARAGALREGSRDSFNGSGAPRRSSAPHLVLAPEVAADSNEAVLLRFRDRAALVEQTWPSCADGGASQDFCRDHRRSLAELAVAVQKQAQKRNAVELRSFAAELFERYFRGAPPDDERLYELSFYAGELYWTLERWSEAATQYRRVVALDPKGRFSARALDAAQRAEENASRGTVTPR